MTSLQEIENLINKIENMDERQTIKLKDSKMVDDNRNEVFIKKLQTDFGEKSLSNHDAQEQKVNNYHKDDQNRENEVMKNSGINES